MKTIKTLFFERNSDSIFKWHHYLPIYDSLFSKFVGQKVTLLEVGVLKGGSLELWRDYFGSNSKIYGIDIDPTAKQFENEHIEIFIGDQSDHIFLQKVLDKIGQVDIVIDDGAHTNYMVMESFKFLFKYTKSIYVVEDTHALYWYWGLYSFMKDICFIAGGSGSILMRMKRLLNLFISGLFLKYNFINYVNKIADSLTLDWHGRKRRADGIWQEGKAKCTIQNRLPSADIFSQITESISYYDSLIVFHKAPQSTRIVETR